MASSPRINRLIFGASALTAAILAYFTIRPALGPGHFEASGTASPHAEKGSAVAPSREAILSGETPGDVASLATIAAAAGVRPSPVLPAAVQDLLPELRASVENWKSFKPDKITIAPYPDLPVEFQMTSVHEEKGRTVWTGRNPALEGAFLVTVATEDDWHATLVVPPVGAFEAHIAGSQVTMLEKELVSGPCGTQTARTQEKPAPLVNASEEVLVTAAAAEDPTKVVDVVFFYDADILASQGSASSIETRIIAYIASSNAALENSQVTNFRWRYLAAYQAPPYTATEDLADDLNLLTGVAPSSRGTGYVSSPGPVSTFAQQKAQLHGADQLVLFVGSNPRRNFAGIAWISPTNVNFHTAAVVWPSTPGSSGAFLTVAHEMAHNFGCRHDRLTENATDGDGQFYYGFRYTRQGRDTGTIMSYASQTVPYYSNPAVTFEGVALGVADADPKAANNARVLREAAQVMIDSRPAVVPPAITAQPQSTAVTLGQGFNLSVTATGANLSFQWKLAGADIAGATGASYSKASSSVSDAGAYTVVVTNVAGSVTSDPATITVNAATSPSTPGTTTPSSGGGGGGGALDAGFGFLAVFAIGARLASRRLTSKKKNSELGG